MHFARMCLILIPLIPCFPMPASSAPTDWKLVWSDEFNTDGLPNPSKWDYEDGFIRNHEEQYYTRSRPENARVENGHMVIEARREPFPNAAYNPHSDYWAQQKEHASYTSAALATKGKTSWKYGRIEIRAKIPSGRGVWPAFWMLGDDITTVNWPRCGEIDIMEFVGNEPDKIFGTVHFAGPDGKHRQKGGKLETIQPGDDFHTYAAEWSKDRIDFFFDDTLYFSFPVMEAGTEESNPFHQPFHILINLAIGGDWGGNIDESAFPQQYIIDYVRVYQKQDNPAP